MHKSAWMRTTLDLPDDVAETLRRESARRGGRAKAPMTQLIAEAVRRTYGPGVTKRRPRIVLKNGHAIVNMPSGIQITSADVESALDEMP